jgi:hypothetical protein
MNRQTVHWEISNTAVLVGATVCAVIKIIGSERFGLLPKLLSYVLRVPAAKLKEDYVSC